VIVHTLTGPPPDGLARALASFEEQFTYPLGPDRSFRVSHGADYPRFFRAIGEPACFVAVHDGAVLGTLGTALRRLRLPDGSERRTVYMGDLKVVPSARRGRTSSRLFEACEARYLPVAEALYGVVMDGTRVTPHFYPRRAGLPPTEVVGHVVVFRIPTTDAPPAPDDQVCHPTDRLAEACHRRWVAGRYCAPAADPAVRSESAPRRLMLSDGSACGLLEDTRQAKRLIGDGGELRSAHLSDFAYRSPADGARLARLALPMAARRGFPALFVAVSADEAGAFREELAVAEAVAAPATIYGLALEPGARWSINTAEI